MARENEITSTERLLDFIRNKTDALPQKKEGRFPAPASNSPRRSAKLIPLRKISASVPVTVGVDIGHEHLLLVRTAKSAEGTPKLVDQRRVPIPAALHRGSDEFANFLRSELDSFCGGHTRQQIWAIMPAAHVEVHHIRIPKVRKKQIESVVSWMIRKESPVNEQESIIDFEILSEVIEQGIPKLSVMYYVVPKKDVEEKKNLFIRAGWPLTGLSIAPFAVQNIFRTQWMAGYEGTVASLFIGNDFSRIDIYAKSNLVMTRGIKAGLSSMLESLVEGLNEKTALTGVGKNAPPVDKDKAREILSRLDPDSPSLPDDARYGLSEQEIWEMILPALERLVRQVERTFEYFTVNLGNERIDKIYVAGTMHVFRQLAEYVGGQLNTESDHFDPLGNKRSGRQTETAGQFPTLSERIVYAMALGIALSDNMHTPNLLFTYQDKAVQARIKQINRAIFIAFIVAVVMCTGMFSYQLVAIHSKKQTVQTLDKQLTHDMPTLGRDTIMKTIAALKQDAMARKDYYQRYQGMALISELSNLSSPNVRLLSLKARLGALSDKPSAPASQDAGKAKPKEDIKEVEIEGFVLGAKNSLDSSLATYMIKLDKSPLFSQVKIQKTSEESHKKAKMLRFSLHMKVEGT